jgi:DNA primase
MAEHREDLDALKASISLVNIVSRSIKLIKRGSRYRALCPFHNERTPSFHVFDDHFHCFGCGRHGDHLAWFTEFERLDFVGAVDRLRAFTGIAPPSTVEIPQSGASIPKHEPNANAIAIWRAGVAVGGTCADRFLQARGITIAAPPSLRAGTDLYLGQYQLPTLVAAVQAPDRTIIAVQVTMIDPRGHKKAQITVPRRTVGALGW